MDTNNNMNMYLFLSINHGDPSNVYAISKQYNVYRVTDDTNNKFTVVNIGIMHSLYSTFVSPLEQFSVKLDKMGEWYPCSLKQFFGEE